MPKAISHTVKHPGKTPGEADVEIPVAEDLVTVPGIPVREKDVSFYSRKYPLAAQSVAKSADREWEQTVWGDELAEFHKNHHQRNRPLVDGAESSGDLEPTGTAEPGKDLTEEIRAKARQLGAGEVGFAKLDRRYVYASRRNWVKYPHAVCLAVEQDYERTQTITSIEAEHTHFGAYEEIGALGLELIDYIRSLGYRGQMHSPSDESVVYVPMFVAAGLGQLGANGQLLSPLFGSRCRLAIVTTDAPVTYDKPVDFGIHKFCQTCQVCVRRCPARALVKEQVWWRGVHKNKVIYDRCRPVMSRFDGCAVCMKVCPIQRHGMRAVMEHYVATGQVLGKGTDELEGFTLRGEYFGPGRLPELDSGVFEFPRGTKDEWLFQQFKDRLKKEGIPPAHQLQRFAGAVKRILDKGQSTRYDQVELAGDIE